MDAEDIESLERATLQAVAPDQLRELPGWLLPMDHGTVGRAHSAVPLDHSSHDPNVVERIAELYSSNSFRPVFRIPALQAFDAMGMQLKRMGFVADQPTLVQTAQVSKLIMALGHLSTEGIELNSRPDVGWTNAFLGEGFDPVDGASRAASLARAEGTRYASARELGVTLACGAASYSHGWWGVHGLRTLAHLRGRGLASKMLLAMALQARRQGIERVFLQVHADSATALALYSRLGFETAWTYAYWREPASANQMLMPRWS